MQIYINRSLTFIFANLSHYFGQFNLEFYYLDKILGAIAKDIPLKKGLRPDATYTRKVLVNGLQRIFH